MIFPFTEPDVTGQVTPQVKPQVTPQVAPQVAPQARALLMVLHDEMNREQLQRALNLNARKNFRLLDLIPALQAGLIERTIPDNPTAACKNTVSPQKANPSSSTDISPS